MNTTDVAEAVGKAQALGRAQVDAEWLDAFGYDADAAAVNEALEYERATAGFDWGEPEPVEPVLPAGVVGDADYSAEDTPQLSDEDRDALALIETEATEEHEQRLPAAFARQPVTSGATFWALTYADATLPRWYADDGDAEAALALELEAGHDVRLMRFTTEEDTRRRCLYDGCSALLAHTGKSGRPRSFCVRHKKSADADRKRRVRAQRQIDRVQSWPTSIGRDS